MGELPASVDAVVVGGGQAGLSMSRLLSLAGREHVVVEARDRIGGGWLDRWDSFCLVTPNWACRMPGGFAYDGPEPEGFMPRDDVVRFLEAYAGSWDAPLVLGTRVTRLSQAADGFLLETTRGAISAREVVVAAGGFQRPNVPPLAAGLSPRLHQLHSHAYRSPEGLPPGAVLVVGSGQSGVQIAEELHEAGRDVFLSVGSAGSLPRRYRGRDIFWWMVQQGMRGAEFGVPPRTVDELPTPRARHAGNPALSGKRGGHDLEPRRLGRAGVVLLGHLQAADGERVTLAPDLEANLAFSDRFFDERMRPAFDRLNELAGLGAGPDEREPVRFDPPAVRELDLRAAGVSTVVWTCGYRLAFDWIDLPIFDDMGYPRHRRGITDVPRLSFLGLPWMHTQASATLLGVGTDAQHLVAQMQGAPVA